jgi:hypothetical protein
MESLGQAGGLEDCAKPRKIPGFRLGSDWRFRRADIDTWIVAQEIKVTFKDQGLWAAATRAAACKKETQARTASQIVTARPGSLATR